MADGRPRDYSSEYNEDYFRPPVPPMRPAARNMPTMGARRKMLDGASKVHREMSGDFLKQVYEKLQRLPYAIAENKPDKLGIDVLNQHYDSVFVQRRKKVEYKVYIQYFKFDEDNNKQAYGETYVVRAEKNTLRQVKNKLPNNKSQFRYFFKDGQNVCHEIESDHSEVPYIEKDDGTRTIYCQVFMP